MGLVILDTEKGKQIFGGGGGGRKGGGRNRNVFKVKLKEGRRSRKEWKSRNGAIDVSCPKIKKMGSSS